MNRLIVMTAAGSIGAALFVARAPVDTAPAKVEAPARQFYSSPNAWSNDDVLSARQSGTWRGEVRLARESDGHFYANATMGAATVRVVVDTGASVVALTGADARAIGLTWDNSEIRPIGRGASGAVHGVVRRVPRIDVGGIIATDVEAMVVPEGLDITLLGQNFLARVTKVEIAGGQMVLSNR